MAGGMRSSKTRDQPEVEGTGQPACPTCKIS